MSIHIKDPSCKKRSKPCRNDMDELEHLICAIDNSKCPSVPSLPSCSIILPPRIEEIPCQIPRRPPCIPPPRCCPITPGPCCLRPLPSPMLPAMLLQSPLPYCDPCHPYTFLPC